ncbi:DNA replication and repair protein RecF [subsurface metagenome]
MLLTKVEINCFRTLVQENSLIVDPKITVLLGANESGKTNLLQAIDKFTFGNNFEDNDISKIAGSRWRRRNFPHVTLRYSLSDDDAIKISSIIPDKDITDEISITKVSNEPDSGYALNISVESQLSRINTELNEKESSLINIQNRNADLIESLKDLISRQKRSSRADTLSSLRVQQTEVRSVINVNDSAIEQYRGEIRNLNELKKKIKRKRILLTQEQISRLTDVIPKIKYVSNIELIPSTIPIAEIIAQNTPRSIAIGNLLNIGNIEDFNFLNEDETRVRIHLGSASKLISDKLSDFWIQEPIVISLYKSGANLKIEFQEAVSVSAPPEERSEGFQWFVSFLANFVIESNDNTNNILLLDEPAIKLHPKGQKDFLKILDDISDKSQIIYTSHSPFLVNRNFPHRIRVLRKSENGTEIINNPYSEGKTRFWEPLKTAIGICLGDLFSFGETNLIVEGISDQILLSGISHQLAKIEKEYLDLEKISIYPAEGASNVIYMGKFALSCELNPIALLDSDDSGKKARQKARDKRVSLKILMTEEFKEHAFTIEDMLPRDDYIIAVNASYDNTFFSNYVAIDNGILDKVDSTKVGIMKIVSDHIEKCGYDVNKTMIMKKYVEDTVINEENLGEYEPFIKLFEKVNQEVNKT